jgi:KDO2-lipid IV(A) lauroyltransferase
MSRQQSRVFDYAVYLAVRLAVCLFQAVSLSTAHAVVAWLAWLAFTVDRRHRLVALENLRKAFPNRYSEAELNRLVLATYRHFFTLMVEISLLPRKVHRHNAAYYFDLGSRGHAVLELLRSERPLLIVTGHFGNWELAGFGLGAHGFRTYAVARPLDNPYLEEFLRGFREHMGQTMLAKKDLRLIKNTLGRGGKIAVLADQSAGPRGLMVDFFGRPASTHKGIAVLALQHQAPMLVVGIRKLAEPMRYHVLVEDIIYPEEYAGYRAEAVRRITQRYASALERAVRTAPEQYFWLHNRWKYQPRPAAEPARAA